MKFAGKLREVLGNAGRRVRDFDRAYADKVVDAYQRGYTSQHDMPMWKNIGSVLGGQPIGTASEAFVGEPFRGARAAVNTANVAARYALPAGLVTAAGMGLADLTARLTGSQQTDSQLPM